MDFHHRMLRSTVAGVIDKTVAEIPHDPGRSIRGIADLGECLAHSQKQKAFFSQAHQVLCSPSSYYYKLAKKLVAQVKKESIRTLGVNLGCTSLTYGVGQLRKQQAILKRPLPWLILCEKPLAGKSAFVAEANALGCYAFFLRNNSPKEVCKLAGLYPESTFFADFRPESLTPEAVESIAATWNLAVSVQVPVEGISSAVSDAFDWLRKSGVFYGFYAEVGDTEFGAMASTGFLREMSDAGCLFGCYCCDSNCSPALPDLLDDFITKTRTAVRGEPLLAVNLPKDLQQIAAAISAQTTLFTCDPARPLLRQIPK